MHRTTKSALWVTAVMVVLASAASAGVVYKDVAELSAAARQVVIGDVVTVSSFWDEQHALIKSRIVVQVDGQMRTGRDVVIGALLGAGIGFSLSRIGLVEPTWALVAGAGLGILAAMVLQTVHRRVAHGAPPGESQPPPVSETNVPDDHSGDP